MRFLTGILFGTALTLLAATAVDAPTHALLERASAQVEAAWDRLVTFTSAALFSQTDSGVAPAVEPAPVNSTVDLTSEAQALALASVPFDLAPIRETQPLQPPARTATAESILLADATPNLTSETEEAAAEVALSEAQSLAAPAATDTAALATVWVPFHSERSALGFARRLTTEIQHPFAVERQGPGAYQVVYEAASVNEIAGLEARIAEVTGR